MTQPNQLRDENINARPDTTVHQCLSSYQEAYNIYPSILHQSIREGTITPQQATFIDEIICFLYQDGPHAHTVENYQDYIMDFAEVNEDLNIPNRILINITRLFAPLLTENFPVDLLIGNPTPNDYTPGIGTLSY